MAARTGSQTPTSSFVLDYSMTLEPEAIEIYGKTGYHQMLWQARTFQDIIAIGSNGLWIHQ